MGKKLFVFTALLALLVLAAAPMSAQDRPLGEITQRIIERGSLICGVNDVLPGFGFKNESGEFSGFDVDICRAVAAAILGDANAVTFRPTTGADRPTVLASGEVDMLSRNTTWTLSRDVDWGASFGPTTFYDGQGIMVRTDSGILAIEELAGGTICTNAGTTTELNITDAMQSRGLEFTLQTFQEFNGAMAAFNEGACDAVTTDISGLVSTKGSSADPGSYTILDIVLSKEPLGPLSPQSDAQFADVVRWVVYGLIQAEEFGINSQNVDSFLTSSDPSIQRFLGIGENLSGTYLGLPNDFMVTVIKSVGNYGEIYERNLTAPFGLQRGVNAMWTDGGLMYAPPFR
jgi:general L-amino acid transport system substrate-binding protein